MGVVVVGLCRADLVNQGCGTEDDPQNSHRSGNASRTYSLSGHPYLGKISFDFRVQVDFCPVLPVSHSDECDVIPILIGSYSSCQRHFLELVLSDCLDLTFQTLAPWFFCFFFTHIFSGIYFHKFLKI